MSAHSSPRVSSFKIDAAISKGMACKFGSDKSHVAKGSANTSKIVGLAREAGATAEDVIEVCLPGGGGPGLLGENVSAGAYLCSHTDGSLVLPNAAGDHVCAIAQEAGSSGEVIACEVVAFEAYNAE